MRISAGLYKNRVIKTPKGLDTRPTSEKLRQAFFNITKHLIEEANFLDLFAGSGAMGLEALSRGASFVTFVDSSRESIQCIKENLLAFQANNKSEILQGDVFLLLEKLIKKEKVFDVIYADPPYDEKTFFQGERISFSECLVKKIDTTSLLKKGGMLFIEDSIHFQGHLQTRENLEHLSSRQFGRSTLHQYQKLN